MQGHRFNPCKTEVRNVKHETLMNTDDRVLKRNLQNSLHSSFITMSLALKPKLWITVTKFERNIQYFDLNVEI